MSTRHRVRPVCHRQLLTTLGPQGWPGWLSARPPVLFGPLRLGGRWVPPLTKGQRVTRAPQPCRRPGTMGIAAEGGRASTASLGPRGKASGTGTRRGPRPGPGTVGRGENVGLSAPSRDRWGSGHSGLSRAGLGCPRGCAGAEPTLPAASGQAPLNPILTHLATGLASSDESPSPPGLSPANLGTDPSRNL